MAWPLRGIAENGRAVQQDNALHVRFKCHLDIGGPFGNQTRPSSSGRVHGFFARLPPLRYRSRPPLRRTVPANREFTRKAPWSDAKALAGELDRVERQVISDRLGATLAEQVYGLAIVARCLLPFSPESASRLHTRLGLSDYRARHGTMIHSPSAEWRHHPERFFFHGRTQRERLYDLT